VNSLTIQTQMMDNEYERILVAEGLPMSVERNPLKVPKPFSNLLFFVLIALLGLLVMGGFLRNPYVNGFYQATFSGMVDGTAYKPFVTRILVPLVIHFVQLLLPANLQNNILGWISNNQSLLKLMALYGVPINYGVEALISLLLQYFCLVGFSFTFYKFAGKVFSFSDRVLKLITIFSTLGLLVFVNYGYIYDFPELFLCTAAFLAILLKQKPLYFLIFVLSVLNKETSIVLVIPSILLFWDLPTPGIRKIVAGLITQVGIYVLIRFMIGIRFQANPGAILSFHLKYQWQGILDHPLYGIASLLIFGCLPILLFQYWKYKPALITLGLISAVVLFVFFVFFGMPFEYRVFYEVYAVSIFAIIHTISYRRNKQYQPAMLTTESFINTLQSLLKTSKS
jgi:hypothetical protein